MTDPSPPLLTTPLNALHNSLNARMVPFAGYSMPVQYPSGLMAEHQHTRTAAGLFDVSHMGQLRLVGPHAASALESLIPMDVIDLPLGRQRYGLLLNEQGGIIDDLMFCKRRDDIFVVVNGACKANDIAHLRERIGQRCEIITLPDQGLLALQGPLAGATFARVAPGAEKLTFMSCGFFKIKLGSRTIEIFVSRSGYTGEDGFEISVAAQDTEALARALLNQPEVMPIGLGARNSLRLEAGLCLYGNDIDTSTNPVEANLGWAIQKVRRSGGARVGGFPGAAQVLAALDGVPVPGARRLVGLVALERVPVREHTQLEDLSGKPIGEVTSGLLGPTIDKPVALAYVDSASAGQGTRLHALVRGKPVPMEVSKLPFVPHRYWRG